jgi:VWFA-related protein
MIAPGLVRSLTALLLLPGTAIGGAGFSTVALAALARPAAAQQQQQQPGQQQAGPGADQAVPLVFGEVLDVRVVNVEVVVTDKDGERVRGLDVKDFRLLVDGKELPIDYFSEIVGGEVVTRDGGSVKEVPSLLPGQPVGTSYLVFIDDFFSIARDRNRVLERLEEQAAALQAEDRMAVVAFDGEELTMLTSWTNSERVLQDALRKARDRPTTGLMRMAELNQNDEDRRQRRDLETTTLSFLDQEREHRLDMQLDPVEMGYATRLIDQLRRSVNAAVATLRGFADPPGRKAMILLSGGWPYNPAEYTVGDYDADFVDVVSAGADPLIPVGRELYGTLSDSANLLGYTLYPVDVPGMQREGRDASTGFPSNEQEASIGGLFPRELQGHASLEFLARETGGEALLNSRRDEAFERVTADTRSYYWMGFTPQRSQDDRPHEIEVEVLRPGLEVRAREGFLDFSKPKEVTMMVESALLFGSPPSTTPLELKFGNPKKAGAGKMSLPLEVGIPMEQVTMIASGGLYAADLELRITVMDKTGGRSDTPVSKIEIRGDRPPQPGQFFRYVTDLSMRRKEHRVVVAVWDPVSGTVMSSSAEVAP